MVLKAQEESCQAQVPPAGSCSPVHPPSAPHPLQPHFLLALLGRTPLVPIWGMEGGHLAQLPVRLVCHPFCPKLWADSCSLSIQKTASSQPIPAFLHSPAGCLELPCVQASLAASPGYGSHLGLTAAEGKREVGNCQFFLLHPHL